MSDADIIREALGATQETEWPADPEYFVKALAALDALVVERDALAELAYEGNEREKALEAQRDEANVQWHKIRDLHADAVSEVARLRADLERDKEEIRRLNHDAAGWEADHRKAEDEAVRLREALERVDSELDGINVDAAQRIARTALADKERT